MVCVIDERKMGSNSWDSRLREVEYCAMMETTKEKRSNSLRGAPWIEVPSRFELL